MTDRRSIDRSRTVWQADRFLRFGLGALLVSLLVAPALGPARAQGDEPPQRRGDGLPARTTVAPAPTRAPVVRAGRVGPQGTTSIVVELSPIADAYIASRRSDQNLGHGPHLFLGYNLEDEHFGAERVLVRFFVHGNIPADAEIHDARLRLYVSHVDPAGDAPMGTLVRRSASYWSEDDVTWDAEPAWGGIRATADVPGAVGWMEWDVTGLVADWVDGTYPDYGLEIIGDEAVEQRERVFYARETSTELHPRLIIDYTDVTDDQPPVVDVDPLPAYSKRSFEVSWSGTDQGPAGIAYYDVQYRNGSGPWVDWLMGVTGTDAAFYGAGGHTYAFRARGVDNVGNVEPFGAAEAQTTIDTTPPNAVIDPLPAVTGSESFTVTWSGTDGGGAGILYYDVRYRYGAGEWQLWQVNTLATAAPFYTPEGDGPYAFEVRAIDQAGNYEPFGAAEETIMVDALAPYLQPVGWLPLMFRAGAPGG
jgi:hypothetical protein